MLHWLLLIVWYKATSFPLVNVEIFFFLEIFALTFRMHSYRNCCISPSRKCDHTLTHFRFKTMTLSPSTSSAQAVCSHAGLTCWLRPGTRGKMTVWIRWNMRSCPGIINRFTPTLRSTSAPRQGCTRPKKRGTSPSANAALPADRSPTCTWPVNSRDIMPLLHHRLFCCNGGPI